MDTERIKAMMDIGMSILLIGVLVVLLLWGGNNVHAPLIILDDPDTETLEDAEVQQNHPTTNYGSTGAMEVSGYGTVKRDGFLKFNLSSIPAGHEITGAYLELQHYEYLEAGEYQQVCVYHVYDYPAYNVSDSPWTEDTITWNNRPTTAEQYNMTPEFCIQINDGEATFTWLNYTCTKMVKTAYAGSYDIAIGVKVNATNTDSFDSIKIYTKETATREPRLHVNYATTTTTTTTTTTLPPTYANGSVNAILNIYLKRRKS